MSNAELFHIKQRAKNIQGTLGTRTAAGYLRNRELPFDVAVRILLGKTAAARAKRAN